MEKTMEQKNFDKFQRECDETTERIAEELEAITNGELCKCPECGEIFKMDDEGTEPSTCPGCGQELTDAEPLTMFEYFDDFLDVEYVVNYDKELKAVRVCVGFGGPNIFVDTDEGAVCLYWGSHQSRHYLTYDTIEAINEWAEDLYNCM